MVFPMNPCMSCEVYFDDFGVMTWNMFLRIGVSHEDVHFDFCWMKRIGEFTACYACHSSFSSPTSRCAEELPTFVTTSYITQRTFLVGCEKSRFDVVEVFVFLRFCFCFLADAIYADRTLCKYLRVTGLLDFHRPQWANTDPTWVDKCDTGDATPGALRASLPHAICGPLGRCILSQSSHGMGECSRRQSAGQSIITQLGASRGVASFCASL